MPLLFVSDGQVNFLISSVESVGPVRVRVVTEGITGPEITVTLVDAAPALFSMAGGTVIATDAKGKLLTADAPAHVKDIVVIYATGLGRTSPNPGLGEIPNYAASMLASPSLKVTLNGTAVDPGADQVCRPDAGIGRTLPDQSRDSEWTGNDPEICVTAGNLAPQTGLKLPLK